MDLFLLYQVIVLIILFVLLINFLVNNLSFKDISRYEEDFFEKKQPPLVSVLIPARNEEKNISRCLKLLLRQDYPNFEIIVLDDNSYDNTYNIVKNISKKDSRVRIFRGDILKKGWMGKNFACHQLAMHAKGKYMIFTDADTLHKGNSIKHSLNCLLENKLDALSVYPRQIMVTIHERMTVSFINFAILLFLPLPLIRKTKNHLFSTAIGQFFLFSREAYFKMGGHAAVKGEILEDIKISKKIKQSGSRFMVFDGKSDIYCRMYRNLREIIIGFSRFIFAAFDFNLPMLCFVFTVFLVIFLMPFIYLPLGFFVFGWDDLLINLLILQVIIIMIVRTMLAIRFKNKIIDILLHPLSMVYIFSLAISSALQSKGGFGILWKDRTYDCRKDKKVEDIQEGTDAINM